MPIFAKTPFFVCLSAGLCLVLLSVLLSVLVFFLPNLFFAHRQLHGLCKGPLALFCSHPMRRLSMLHNHSKDKPVLRPGESHEGVGRKKNGGGFGFFVSSGGLIVCC